MNHRTARLIAYNDEMHLVANSRLAVGDTLEVIRGNGPREGDRMGTATVTALDELGDPAALDIRLDGQRGAPAA